MEQRFVNWPNQSALQSISLCFTIHSRAKPVSITTNISLFYHPFTDSDRRELQHAVMSVIVTQSINLEDARRTQRRLSALLLSEIQTDRQRFPVSNHLHRLFARHKPLNFIFTDRSTPKQKADDASLYYSNGMSSVGRPKPKNISFI